MRDPDTGNGHEPQGIEPQPESEIPRGPNGVPLYSRSIDDATAMRTARDLGALLALGEVERLAMLNAARHAWQSWEEQATEQQRAWARQRAGRFDVLECLELCGLDIGDLRHSRLFDAAR